MNFTSFFATFPRQLRYWALHCCLNALPSFAIALAFLKLWEKPFGIAAMLCGIATFIILYALITSLVIPLANEKHILSRSLRLGTKIRAWISGLSVGVLLLSLGQGMMLVPDFWCGWLSIAILHAITSKIGYGMNHFDVSGSGSFDNFFTVYATTVLEGFILSFILLMISFFAILFIQSRDRKKMFLDAHAKAASQPSEYLD